MRIKIGNSDVTKYIGSPSWSTDDETNGMEMNFTSLKLFDIGSHVKVADEGKTRFYGVIISMEENPRAPHSYKALDFSYNLKGDEIIQFKKMAADKAISQLLSKQGIKSKVCSIPTKISKIYKGAVIDIVKDILRIAKKDQGKSYFLEVDGTTVVVAEKKKEKISPKFIMADDTAISRSIESLRNEVVVIKGNKVLAKASDSGSISKLGTIRHVEEAKEKTTTAKAQATAKKQLSQLDKCKSSKQITLLVTEGYWDIRKNRLIKINGGGLKGWYRIKSSSHIIDGSAHKVQIEVEWDAGI